MGPSQMSHLPARRRPPSQRRRRFFFDDDQKKRGDDHEPTNPFSHALYDETFTWTRDSVSPILMAISSLMKMSG